MHNLPGSAHLLNQRTADSERQAVLRATEIERTTALFDVEFDVHAIGTGRAQDRSRRGRNHLRRTLQSFEMVRHLHERLVPSTNWRPRRRRQDSRINRLHHVTARLGTETQLDQRGTEVEHVTIEKRFEASTDAAGRTTDWKRQ